MVRGYTSNAWAGELYEKTKDLSTTEIAKLIRKEIRQKFPDIKVSVRTEYFSGGSSIDVKIMDWNKNPIHPNYDHLKLVDNITNPYYTEEATKLLEEIQAIGDKYRFSDCDGMIDYYNVNFWFSVEFDYTFRDRMYQKNRELKK